MPTRAVSGTASTIANQNELTIGASHAAKNAPTM